MTPSQSHKLEIDSVELSFGNRQILSGVYLSIETGLVTSLLGRNGCGKSCLMKILFGTLKPYFYSMCIDGQWRKRFNESELGYLAQRSSIPKWMTPDGVVRDFDLDWGSFVECFPQFDKLRKQKIYTLSGGEERLLECYAVLNSRAKFVMLDEPFSQVSPLNIVKIQDIIAQQKVNKGILLTDHMVRHVLPISDRIYLLSDGYSYQIQDEEDLIRYGYMSKH